MTFLFTVLVWIDAALAGTGGLSDSVVRELITQHFGAEYKEVLVWFWGLSEI